MDLQWKEPIRFLYKGYGVTFWKWSGVLVPLTCLHFGGLRMIGFDIFNNGFGFTFRFYPVISIDVCISGKIGWWYKRGILRIWFLKWCYEW